MKAPAIPADEVHRLDALHSLALLDTAPEADFDSIVQLGRALFSVPTCLVSLIDKDRQWFKACVGLNTSETPRAISFCGHAILGPDVFVITDARQDDRFHDNPLVTGAPFIRFYAGAPIRLPSGYTIGTVCVISPEPRAEFPDAARQQLAALANLAVSTIAVRALRADLDRNRGAAERALAVLQTLATPVALLDPDGKVQEANEAFVRLCAGDPQGQAITDLLPVTAGVLAEARASGSSSVRLLAAGSLAIMPDSGGYAVIGAAATEPGEPTG